MCWNVCDCHQVTSAGKCCRWSPVPRWSSTGPKIPWCLHFTQNTCSRTSGARGETSQLFITDDVLQSVNRCFVFVRLHVMLEGKHNLHLRYSTEFNALLQDFLTQSAAPSALWSAVIRANEDDTVFVSIRGNHCPL